MAARRQPLLEHVHRLAARLDPEADAVLLERFVRQCDHVAFEALVHRHGSMVLGVCRRVLGNAHDAEDVFQATFLVLARKAASGRPPDSLPAWLHTVAHRLALKHRQSQRCRQRRETRTAQAAETPARNPLEQLTAWEMLQALDEELQRLPEFYRLPLILCCLEGRTQDEAADMLGWTLDSVKGRLKRGRALLHARLARRGMALGMGLLAAAALGQGFAAGLPAGLTRATVEAALCFAAGGKVGVSAGVMALAEEGMIAVRLTGMKIVAALLGLTLAVSAGGVLARQIGAREAAEPRPRLEESRTGAETPGRLEPADKAAARADRYGDPLPPGALARLGTVRLRHVEGIYSLAFTRDGKGLITAGRGNPARLWDMATGRLLRQFGDSRTEQTCAIELSSDGRTLAMSAPSTGGLSLWDVSTGTLLRRLKRGQAGQVPLTLSPDGKTVALRDGQTLRFWETATGKELWAADGLQVSCLAYSADNKALIWGGPVGDLHLWDAASGKELRRWDDEQKRPISVCACSPDGRLFAAYDPYRRRAKAGSLARLWDTATGKEVWTLADEEAKGITTAAFSPDGKVLATGCTYGPLRLWNAITGKELCRCEGCRSVLSLAFAPDGKTLASGSAAGGGKSGYQTVRLWDVRSGREVRRVGDGHEGTVCSLAFTPDGKDIVSGSWEGSVRLWDAATGEQRRPVLPAGDEHIYGGRIASLASAISLDGKTLFSATFDRIETKSSVQVRRWDRESGRELPGWSREVGNTSPYSLVISPDGKTVACMTVGPTPNPVYVWEAATGKELCRIAGGYPAFSPDGKLLAAVVLGGRPDVPGSFTLWEAATGKAICSLTVPEGRVHGLLFSPDGRMLATTSNSGARGQPSAIHLWPLSRDESHKPSVRVGPPRVLAEGVPLLLDGGFPSFWFGAWAFAPDGRTLALAAEDGTIRLLETATGKERARFAGHGESVTVLSFSPDGRRLASGSRDTTILVWDATGRLREGHLQPARLSTREVAKLWTDLRADDAERSWRAIWTLTAAPAQAVPYLKEHLRTATVDTKPLTRVPQLLCDLDDDVFAVRQQAKAELARLGAAAEPALRQALAKESSLETRRSLEQLLKAVEANRQTLSGESLRGVRAVEVLEHIGSPEARQALKDLTAGTRAELSLLREARAALDRLDRVNRR